MRTVTHFSLHRINGTELRTIADVDDGVIQLMQREENVIRGYARAKLWRHRRVMLFVMRDLDPLMRQVQTRPGFTRDRIAAIQDQPATVLYDLKALDECSVYVNRAASERAGYWDDPLTMEGLLAHEHAHPIAENDTVRASRQIQLDITTAPGDPLGNVLTVLGQQLGLYAPREIFANETALRAGFVEAMAHLNQRLIRDAAAGIPGRAILVHRLEEAVVHKAMRQEASAAVLLAGDLQMCLPLAIEVAPFYRCGLAAQGAQLESVLQTGLFPMLTPMSARVESAYGALRDAYVNLPATLTAPALIDWCTEIMQTLVESLATVDYSLKYALRAQQVE